MGGQESDPPCGQTLTLSATHSFTHLETKASPCSGHTCGDPGPLHAQMAQAQSHRDIGTLTHLHLHTLSHRITDPWVFTQTFF